MGEVILVFDSLIHFRMFRLFACFVLKNKNKLRYYIRLVRKLSKEFTVRPVL